MNIFIINTVGSGLDTIDLLKNNIPIKGIIGLSERNPGDKISDYVYQSEFCDEAQLNFIEVESYTLTNEKDKDTLLSLDIDVLIVAGWQRLLPEWLIAHCKVCAIGAHGSPFSITGGRGRSPQNWALLLGLKHFFISIFSVDKGIDSGKIIDTRKFYYNEHDDIRSSYHKVSLLVADMIIENINNGKIEAQNFLEQKESDAFYFPKRTPDDGYIDWSLDSEDIYNLIRGLTRPYPGAMTKVQSQIITIYKAIPFNLELSKSYRPGEIAMKFHNGDFLVATRDSFLLVTEYSGDLSKAKINDMLESVSRKDQFQTIVNRHTSRYPTNRVTEVVMKLT